MKIEVTAIEAVEDKGNLRALASISLDNLIKINFIRIVQQPGQKAWVQMPQYKRDGRFLPIAKLEDSALKDKITAAILNEFYEADEATLFDN